MADLNINIRITPRIAFWSLAAFCLSLMSVPVSPEDITLDTYYPAPSGIYTNMVTTQQTILARDSGNVGIQTPSPAYTLDVNGNERISGDGLYNSAGYEILETDAKDWLRINPSSSWSKGVAGFGNWAFGSGGVAIGAFAANVPAGNLFVSGNVGIGSGATSPTAALEVASGGYIKAHQNCAPQFYTIGTSGNIWTSCPNGDYATYLEGIDVPYQQGSGGDSAAGQGTMYCCPM